jgi:hypothetical protein
MKKEKTPVATIEKEMIGISSSGILCGFSEEI